MLLWRVTSVKGQSHQLGEMGLKFRREMEIVGPINDGTPSWKQYTLIRLKVVTAGNERERESMQTVKSQRCRKRLVIIPTILWALSWAR